MSKPKQLYNFLQEKQEAQDASDESSELNENEHLDKLFDFLYKTNNNTKWRDCATKIFESFVDQKP